MPLRFNGVTVNNRHFGFDPIAPKEIVCRKGEIRVLWVPPNEPGVYEFRTTNKTVATAQSIAGTDSSQWLVEISGKAKGEAEIQAVRDGVVEDRVRVFVYPHRTVKVNVFRVFEAAHMRGPAFLPAHSAGLIAGVNTLFKYQANITFELHLNKSIILDPALNIDLTTPNQSESAYRRFFEWMKSIRDQKDPSPSHLNLFPVKFWSAKDQPDAALESGMRNVFGTTHGNCCVVEDLPSTLLRDLTVAHEFAHALGAEHAPATYPESLMAPQMGPTHFHLYPFHVRQMRGNP